MRQIIALAVLVFVGCATQPKPIPQEGPSPLRSDPKSIVAQRPAGTRDLEPCKQVPGEWTLASLAKGALLFEGLGSYHRAIDTRSKEAQAFFDQGLRLAYGFNHDEAARSFARAAQLDPGCAICFWGASLTLGPNYNIPMLPERAKAAWQALQQAQELAPRSGSAERALIEALGKRYKGPESLDTAAQQPFNEAFAVAMREGARQFPDDLDVQVLFAEALMDVNPWKLWTLDGKPASGTEEIVATLERVLSRAPEHPGANHYLIHALEASRHPEQAVRSADRLARLMPAAGHIVHMPAHIYQRIGRYADATETNRAAAETDLRYMKLTTPPGYYPMYLGHNYGFLAYSAAMEGRSTESLTAAREAVKAIPPEMLEMMPGMDFLASEPLLVMVRFGRWKEILQEPRPPDKFKTLQALWLHARGMAHASLGQLAEARGNLDALLQLQAELPADIPAGLNTARDLAALGAKAIAARVAEMAHNKEEAIALWREAVAMEDKLAYSEPADWFYPLRHYLGAALMAAKRFKDAEVVYRQDLERNPKNGWSLFGLWQSLRAQSRREEAAEAQKYFRASWRRSDIELTRSAL